MGTRSYRPESFTIKFGLFLLQTGSGTTAYIVDTGILSSHQEFSGRVLSGYTAISDGNGTTDCNGHGTHVAGTVGGTTYGVAKSVNLVPIRILGCDGSEPQVMLLLV